MGLTVEVVFNVEKCQVVNFAGQHNAVAFNYKLDGKILAVAMGMPHPISIFDTMLLNNDNAIVCSNKLYLLTNCYFV